MGAHRCRQARMELKPSATPAKAPPAQVAERLVELVLGSPVAQRGGIARPDPKRVAALGKAVEERILQHDPDVTVADLETRVYRYYLPIYLWMRGVLAEHRAASTSPLIMGFSCPQGGGKSTMVGFMRMLFHLDGLVCSGASLDDFYLTHKEQTHVASLNWQNGLLRYRGNPGTHDVNMLCDALDQVSLLNTPDAPEHVAIPQYDKTCFSGRGDRRPMKECEFVANGLDVFLLEGWCMGFQSVGQDFEFEDPVVSPSGCLRVVDRHLQDFDLVYKRMHGMLVIEVDDLGCVYDWRAQPEREAIAAGKPGMTPDEIRDFVSRFMPSYDLYTRELYGDAALFAPDRELHIKINRERQPVDM